MKIPAEFPQFEDENVLIVVTGAQDADIYFVSNGVFEKIKSIQIPRRRYSDEEGFSVQKSGVSGSAREYPKEAVRQEFLNELERELKAISKKEKITSVCLFSPDYFLKTVKSSFPYLLRDKIKVAIAGNYIHYRPLEILEKIKLKVKKSI